MGKQSEDELLKNMSVTERFKYIADKKRMQHNIDTSNVTCSYSGLPSMEVYQDEPEASLEEQAKYTDWEDEKVDSEAAWKDEWIDRDESEWDSSSDGRSKRGSTSNGDDSNEY